MCDKIGNDADTYTALASPKAASAPCSTTIVFEVLPPLVLRLVGRFLFDRLEPTGDCCGRGDGGGVGGVRVERGTKRDSKMSVLYEARGSS